MEERAAERVPLPRPCAVPLVRPSPPLSSCEYHSITTVRKKSLRLREIITCFDQKKDNSIAGFFFTIVENRTEQIEEKFLFCKKLDKKKTKTYE